MKVLTTAIDGVVILEPEVFGDARGYFFESYSRSRFNKLVRPVDFVQDNESRSRYGVIRGLHFQRGPHAQSKLVRVVEGSVLDAADKYQPYVVARAVINVCSCFNKFYYELRIMDDDSAVRNARLALTDAARTVISTGLRLVGLNAPERM